MVVIRDPKLFSFNFDCPKDVDENFNDEMEFIIKSFEPLADNKILKKTKQFSSKYKHENNIQEHRKYQKKQTNNTKKKSESIKFVLNLSQRSAIRSLSKHVSLRTLSIYTWKNIRKQ